VTDFDLIVTAIGDRRTGYLDDDVARETPLSRGRESRRLPASAKAVTTTRKRGIAINKTTATRNRTRIASLPSPMFRARCPDTEN